MKNKNIEKIKSLSWTVLVASATIFAACSNDDNILEEQPVQPTEPQVYNMTVEASKGGDEAGARATNRALSLDGSTLNATWSALTDNVYVKKGSTWATGSLQPQADGTTATLKGTLSGITIEANDALNLQFPKSGDISYDGQLGTLADIAANFDYATATVDVGSVSASGNIVPKTATTSFTNQQAIIKFTLKRSNGSALPSNPTAFTISDGTNTVSLASIPAATYTANGTGVLYVAFPAAGSAKIITLTATVGLDTYTYEKTGVTFTNGRYYAITVKMTPAGALSGQFSVGSGTKVYFSKGNLQYTKSTGKWSFMTNQYSTVETLNQTVGTNYASQNVVSLFGWGTSGSAPSGQTARASYYTNANNDDYVSNITTTGVSWGTGSEWDWGTAAASDLGSGWRTLTKDEWVYLFNTRTVNNGQGSGKSYTLGQTVNDVLGVVLYPDDYTGTTYTTSSDWSTFESAGCVFLPAAGYRTGPSVYDVGSLGAYWSSTASSASNAYYVRFISGTVNPANNSSRHRGYSVRLVRPVE